jgi:putative phage-type endonuclease
MLERIECDNREDWLQARRQQGIGGSDAAAAIGMSPWTSPVELWKIKLGITAQKDLSGNAAVQRGVEWEPILRDIFAQTHPELTVTHHPYDILFQSEREWLCATLDGEIVSADGRKGVLEIKTSSPRGRDGFNEWANGHIPQHYYIQTLHELLASGYDFVNLYAALFSLDGTVTLKPVVEIERDEVQDDLEWLLNEEERFMRYVTTGRMPPMPLSL